MPKDILIFANKCPKILELKSLGILSKALFWTKHSCFLSAFLTLHDMFFYTLPLDVFKPRNLNFCNVFCGFFTYLGSSRSRLQIWVPAPFKKDQIRPAPASRKSLSYVQQILFCQIVMIQEVFLKIPSVDLRDAFFTFKIWAKQSPKCIKK